MTKEQLCIAYVDDDQILRETFASHLSRLVESVEVFEKPQEVIERFVADDRPEVLLTDGHMPEMNGLQLARVIRAKYPTTTIILVSAGLYGASLNDPDELKTFGIDLFIPKNEFEARAAVEKVKGLRAQQQT